MATGFAELGGWSNISPAVDWTARVNEAWQQLGWDCEHYVTTETVTAVNGQVEYALATVWKLILDVTYNAVGLIRTTEDFERAHAPSWRSTAAGTPKRWLQVAGFTKVGILPAPNGTQSIVVRGVTSPPVMASGSESPSDAAKGAFPAAWHEAIAMLAAANVGKAYGDNERAAFYFSQVQDVVNKVRLSGTRGWVRGLPGE